MSLMLMGAGSIANGTITVPTLVSATISADGETLTLVWNQAVDWVYQPSLTVGGGTTAGTDAPTGGSGTDTLTFSISVIPSLKLIQQGDAVSMSLLEGGVTAVWGGLPNAEIVDPTLVYVTLSPGVMNTPTRYTTIDCGNNGPEVMYAEQSVGDFGAATLLQGRIVQSDNGTTNWTPIYTFPDRTEGNGIDSGTFTRTAQYLAYESTAVDGDVFMSVNLGLAVDAPTIKDSLIENLSSTGTQTGASTDWGAVDPTTPMFAVQSIGGFTGDSLDGKLQESNDDATWSDVRGGVFFQATPGATYQFIWFARTKRYVRWVGTIAGGTISIDTLVYIGRGLNLPNEVTNDSEIVPITFAATKTDSTHILCEFSGQVTISDLSGWTLGGKNFASFASTGTNYFNVCLTGSATNAGVVVPFRDGGVIGVAQGAYVQSGTTQITTWIYGAGTYDIAAIGVPTGVDVTAYLYGDGGGGQGGSNNSAWAGGGGGGGAYGKFLIPEAAWSKGGQMVVGSGAVGGSQFASGGNGDGAYIRTVSNSNKATAAGGVGGHFSGGKNVGGAGGTTYSSGSVTISTSIDGAAGQNAGTTPPAIGGDGGQGANGGGTGGTGGQNTDDNGSDGTAVGGGGGGAATGTGSGGHGAVGKAVISYVP